VNRVDFAQRCIEAGGHVHLIGIGGVGMAGLAYLLKQRGFRVSGCDQQENRLTDWLRGAGVVIVLGHAESHLQEGVDWVIRTTAVPDAHPEVQRAHQMGIPVSRRGEVLPALMRSRFTIAVSGTHGKTTTTALIAQVLDCGFCVGGEMVGIEGVARDGEIMVVEADESDGTIAGYSPDIAVITNIEFDHMEHHADEAAFIACFERLIEQTKEQLYYCHEDRHAAALAGSRGEGYGMPEPQVELPIPGRHNQLNASAVIKVCSRWMDESAVREKLKTVRCIHRRFETIYHAQGIRVISDYAHHPTEIAALIATAKGLHPNRLLAIFQPHRYTRTRALAAAFAGCFTGLDRLWLAPVYAASEPELAGGTSRDLIQRLPDYACYVDRLEVALSQAVEAVRPGDLLLIIGAGDIERLAETIRMNGLK
jgi:UDP-N-acetylmuramate--alanine ligase